MDAGRFAFQINHEINPPSSFSRKGALTTLLQKYPDRIHAPFP
jgi:hypothetical protein